MSIKEHQLSRINRSILALYQAEDQAPGRPRKAWFRFQRWVTLLRQEFIKNDVAIRAQSLSYFTLFSLLPLLTGVFLVLGFFSQWGPVQKEFEGLLGGALGSIPEEQRNVLMAFIVQFKDQYLENLSQKSGKLGVFAVLVLFWIAARVFFNVESLMNRIWRVRSERPWLERFKNFVLFMVLMPLCYALAISLPRVLTWVGNRHVSAWFDQGLLGLLVFLSLWVILKSFPNTRVSWKSSGWGAFAGFAGFGISNSLLRIYFRMGTETAYGKAAILPILAFFIYIAWCIFIFAVEVSLLVERGDRRIERALPSTTLAQALVLRKLVALLEERFHAGKGPVPIEEISRELGVGIPLLDLLVAFLEQREWVVLLENSRKPREGLSLARSVGPGDLRALIQDFLDLPSLAQDFDVSGLISEIREE